LGFGSRMNEFYRAKFNELFAEFTRYLVEHPEFAGQIPDGAEVILLDSRDSEYNRYVLTAIRAAPPEHPVVYVEVGELAPVRSRLRNPTVLPAPAAHALA
jgi:hypothetical protein